MKINLNICGAVLFILLSALPLNAQLNKLQSDIAESKKKAEIAKAEQAVKNADRQEKEISAAKKEVSKQIKEKPASPKIVTLSEIKFSPSQILPQSFLDEIRKEYTGKPLSAEDIDNILTKVNNKYLLLGYIAAKAYLPEQDITSGVMFVSLMEAKINESKIIGNNTTSANFINSRIRLIGCDMINVNDIERDILYFNASNDVKARAALEPGPVYGTTDINLVMTEPSRLSLVAFSDNAGQEDTGLECYGAYAVLRSLTGQRDILTFGGMLSKGSESYFASYEIPEPLLKTRISVGFDYSTTEIISGPLHPLNVDGHFYDYYIYVKKPFWVTETMISNFNLNFSAKNGANYVDSYRTQTTKTDLITLSLDNIWIFNGGYLFNLVSAGQGVKALEGKNEFTKINYSGEFQTALWGPLAFNLKGKAQIKAGGHNLPSSEQFQLGGVNTVRGYTEGMLIGDKGFDVMSELQFDFTSPLPRFITYAKLFVFFDYGRIYPSKDTITPEGYDKDIYSAGGGLRMGFFNRLDGSLTLARTLNEHPSFGENETKVLFYVQARIF